MSGKMRELTEEEGNLSENLLVIRKFLLGMGRREVSIMTHISSTALVTYEDFFSDAAPSVLTVKKLCDLYGVAFGDMCESDYSTFWCVSSEAEKVLIRCLKRFGEIDCEPYAKEACKVLGLYRLPHSRHLVRIVTEMQLRRAVGDASKARPVPVPEDTEILGNLSRNLQYLTELCGVRKTKISESAGIPLSRISSAMKGEDVSVSAALRLSRFFSVPVGELVSEKPDFGDERVIAGNVALGLWGAHPQRHTLSESATEYNREIEIKLGREDAEKIVFDTFSELDK